jgi:hypothetical protein
VADVLPQLCHGSASFTAFYGSRFWHAFLLDDDFQTMASSSSGRKGVNAMSAVRALREKLGDDGMAELQMVVSNAGRQWKDDVLAVAGERFERIDMAKEFAAVRVDMAKEFAAVRSEMAAEFANVRAEFANVRRETAVGLAQSHAHLLKWSFLFWVGQVAAMGAMMAFLLNSIATR